MSIKKLKIMTNAMVEDIQSHLSGLNFPANKQAILNQVKRKNASHEVVASLNGISDREYLDLEDLMKEMESR